MTLRARRLLQVGAGVVLGLVVTGLFVAPDTGIDPPRTLAADVPLIDMTAQPTTLSAFQGGWTLLFFGFTHCPDVCPVTLQRIAAGVELLDERGALESTKLTVALVTVDPTRDSPAVLAEYLAPFGARFVGLTASDENHAALMNAYDILVQPVEPGPAEEQGGHGERDDGEIDTQPLDLGHTSRIHVLDPDGRLIGEIPPWPGAQDMADAIASIVSGSER